MTKSAWLLLILAVATAILGLNLTAPDGQVIAFIASGVLSGMCMLAIIVGRRFKFDPVLR